MGALKVNGTGYFTGPIWSLLTAETEAQVGVNNNNIRTYLYSNADSRGIYDSGAGSIIEININGVFFKGTATWATNADTVDGYHASSLTKDFTLDHSIFDNLTNSGYGGVTYCGSSTDGFLYIGREWGRNNDGNNFGMQIEVSGWDGVLRTRSFDGWGSGWSSWKTYIHDGNIGSQSVNYANSAGNADTVDGHHFHWSGQSGQPTWLWGGNDITNMYVYNPSNFNVNYANSAGYASSTNYSLTTENKTGCVGQRFYWYEWSVSDQSELNALKSKWDSILDGMFIIWMNIGGGWTMFQGFKASNSSTVSYGCATCMRYSNSSVRFIRKVDTNWYETYLN